MLYDDIIQWAENQDNWEKEIIKKILDNINLNEEQLNEIYNLFKEENVLCTISNHKKIEFSKSYNTNITNNKVKLKCISEIVGVNALDSNSKLELSDNLTLVYGKNGSGKSGYTRLLNVSFNSRGDTNILPNVFKTDSEKPKANFSFVVNGKNIEKKYPEDRDSPVFKNFSVFDSKSIRNDLSKDSEFTINPTGFEFFNKLLSAINIVKNKLDTDISEHSYEIDLLAFFTEGTEVYNLIKNLNSKSNFEQFKTLSEITKSEKNYMSNQLLKKKD